MKNDFLQEAIKIGDQLLTSAEHDANGIFWKTADLDIDTNKITWSTSEGLYSGVSGIAFFLIELYLQTNDKKYLQTAEKAMKWVAWYCKQNPTTYYAFFTGRLGVSWVYLKLHEVTKNEKYIVSALEIAKESLIFLENQYGINELINGISGTLLGLLHLHAATGEDWLLDYIQKYTDRLLKKARFGKVGLYWDSNENEIHPLCGFSHGTSGIGFVFLELGHYFKNPAFYYIAEQAFAYENYYFDKDSNNWPDFRMNMYTQKNIDDLEGEYIKGDVDVFTKAKDMNAWCHGAAGIGLSRLRAQKILNNKNYEQDIQRVYDKTLVTHLHSFTLCHGDGGNADFFIEYFLLSEQKDALKIAETIARRTLEQKEVAKKYSSGLNYDIANNPEDPSLFNGIAGIGYFLLRVSNSKEIPSILAPKINKVSKKIMPKQTLTLPAIKKILLSNIFPRTIQHAEQYSPEKLESYFQSNKKIGSEVTNFVTFIKFLFYTLPSEQQELLNEYFTLEFTKISLYQQNLSNAFIFIKEKVANKNAVKMLMLSDKEFFRSKLQLAPEIKLVSGKSTISLCKLTPYGVEELPINQFCYLVLNLFSKKLSVKSVITSIYKKYNTQTEEEIKFIKEKTMEQIREAVRNKILLIP